MKWLRYVSTILGITGLVAAGVYLGGIDPKTGIPDPVLGITFPYTDDNTGECLHIYTNADAYTNGLSHAEVYAAVVNNCGVTQDVELLAYFADTKKRVENVAVLTSMTRTRPVPVFENVCREIFATSSKEAATVCNEEQVGTTKEQYEVLDWIAVPLIDRVPAEVSKETAYLAKETVTRKEAARYTAARKSAGATLQPGDVVYYKVIIKYEPNQSGSFFFTAIGSEGGYGHLQ